MSYVMQGAQRMGGAVAFGALPSHLNDYQVRSAWQRVSQGVDRRGKIAVEGFVVGPSGTSEPTAAEWVEKECEALKFIYVTPPYVNAGTGKKEIALYAGTEALPQGFAAHPHAPAFAPLVCPGAVQPPAQPPPGGSGLSEDEKLVAAACLAVMADPSKRVTLPRVVEVAGQHGNVVRFDEAKNDCVLELAETSGKSKHLIFGAMALVAVAGGVYLYKKKRSR